MDEVALRNRARRAGRVSEHGGVGGNGFHGGEDGWGQDYSSRAEESLFADEGGGEEGGAEDGCQEGALDGPAQAEVG